MKLNDTFQLSNGIHIPKLGLGTWMIEGQQAEQAVLEALKLGYRHLDTAQDYGNEAQVADGIRASGLAREEVFITTKLAAQYKNYADAKAAIDDSLQRMRLDHVDLMIIHSPQPWGDFGAEDRYFSGNSEAWRALEEAYQAGKIKAIGLSNFQQPDVENILQSATLKPMVNQILAHVTNLPNELIDYCRSQDILVEAYSPIGHGELLKNTELKAMADRYQVSLPQLCIRFVLQLGLLPLPKTANPAHMSNNADLDFEISEDDMQALSNMKKIADYGEASVFPVYREHS
ncbi:aldo/keto reductase [Reinekea blandensis]|uniref:Aldo/keto reductase n=1 Tax=Reinekea blandensis MED297 TaxID=314283 RepID=A4BDU3_9GAMM|nr:aldo/keto reductase [Reinekea blandensis]EAR09702.1 Aldo/keto reductase [Reinekea blandensis MED297]